MSVFDKALHAIRVAQDEERKQGSARRLAALLRAEAELLLAVDEGGALTAKSGTGLPPRPPGN